MNLIEELIKKYDGNYSEERKKSSIYHSGKYTFHPQKGILEINGSQISVNIQAVSGAAMVSEPYRIVLYLKKEVDSFLTIYPKSDLRKIFSRFFTNNKSESINKIETKFKFTGDPELILRLKTDQTFVELISNEEIYIKLTKKHPDKIILRPAYGLDDVNHLEKMISTLRRIEYQISSNSTQQRI